MPVSGPVKRGPVTRTASVLLAATIGAMAPGIVPVASAQPAETSVRAQSQGGSWRPPPVTPGMRPDGNDGQPLGGFTKETECIRQDRSADIKIQREPWGQQYLQIKRVHELMRATTDGAGLQEPNGEPITVAVVDTGVRKGHPWLPNVRVGGDYVKVTDKGAGREDCDGHGTLVAGIISASTPDHVGFKGVAPDAEIFPVRQSSSNYKPAEEDKPTETPEGDKQPSGDKPPAEQGGDKPSEGDGQPSADGDSSPSGAAQDGTQGSGVGNLESLANAVVFAASNPKVDVMNISIDNCQRAGQAWGPNMAALQAAVKWAAEAKDVVVVASAGNKDGKRCKQNNKLKPRTIVAPPWFSKHVLSVAAIDSSGGVADFSMRGPWVSVAAPGTNILSLDPAEGSNGLANLMLDNGKPARINGTSFAAPYVTGLVALVRAKYPNLDAYQVMDRITSTAQHPASLGGRNQYVGFGIINPMAALTTTMQEVQGEAKAGPAPADLPPPADRDWTPVVVALGGAGGALVALLITLFTVHTIRRNRTENA